MWCNLIIFIHFQIIKKIKLQSWGGFHTFCFVLFRFLLNWFSILKNTSVLVCKKWFLTSADICPSWAMGRSCRHTPAAAASLSRRCQRSRSSTPGWQPEPGSHPVTPETTGPFGWCNSQTCFPAPRSGEGPPWIVVPEEIRMKAKTIMTNSC